MAYRKDARAELPEVRFWYGPFRPTGLLTWVMAGAVVAAPLAYSAVTATRVLSCERQSGICEYQSKDLLNGTRTIRFGVADVSDVRFVQGSGKSKNTAAVVLVFRSGRDLRLPSEPVDDAKNAHTKLVDYFQNGVGASLRDEHEMAPATKLGVAAVATVVLGYVFASLGNVLPVRVRAARDRVWISRRNRSIDTSRVTKIVVEPRPDDPRLRRVAVVSGDAVDYLLPEARGGLGPHQRAAVELGRLLEVPVDTGPEPMKKPFVWPKLPKLPKPIPLGWKLMAFILIVSIGGSVASSWHDALTQGTIEIDCEGRCRFGGMECMPGGSVSMTAPEGTFTVETWAPDEPSRWKSNAIQVSVGVTSKFTCPPTR